MPPEMLDTATSSGNGSSAVAPAQTTSDTSPTFLDTQPGPDHDWRITLKDKVIAITGANRGIGLALAEVCLANEAAAVFSLDVFEPGEDVNTAIDAVITARGAIHGFIANAGMTKHQPAFDFTRAQLDQLFNLNVFGAYFCATAVARRFIELGIKGSIVFTASMTSYRPNRAAPSAPYGATKGAVRNMTHTLAMEWAKHGIRVNSISPGFIKTAMTYFVDQAPDWDLKMQYYGGMPRLADPKELGGAYVYLLSDGASYTTGIDIPVAGIVGAW
ncbi:Enoyl-Acyl carrier protein reductase [Aspergillus parasiticus SU-1]|uniref:Enoyl-Acyl carrier protein reductase n=1 Tax=Aspergillus parasiticus (strain ATCC 56775 / NRRL 5862 / SRRC 143 / SU-1) TaxID=1403190 RepID=A0A0F0IG58_ASPPU|nr:Enoyl-Acyl carrier protein reductase [Aspergillus parasiticus SU-1]